MTAQEREFDQFIQNQIREQDRKAHKNEDFISATPRIAAQYGSRAAESVASIPEPLIGWAESLGETGANLIRKGVGAKPIERDNEPESKIRWPSQQKLREFSEEKTKGYTKPRGPWEDFGGEIVSDTAPMLALGGAGLARSLATSTAGNLAKQGVKLFGGGETAQNLTKLGTMIIGGSINPGAARQATTTAYNTRDALLPRGARTSTNSLERALTAIENKSMSGGPSPASAEIQRYTTGLRGRMDRGSIPVKELTDAKVKINQNRGKFGFTKDDRKLYNDIAHAVDESLSQYGQRNPAFYKAHKAADAMHSVIAEGSKYTNQLIRHIKSPLKSAVGAVIGYAAPVKTGIAAATAFSAAKSYEVFSRIQKNPDLRKLYTQMMLESSRNNIPTAIKALHKLDEKYLKEYPEEDVDFEQFAIK